VSSKEVCAQIWEAIHYSISRWKIHERRPLFIAKRRLRSLQKEEGKMSLEIWILEPEGSIWEMWLAT